MSEERRVPNISIKGGSLIFKNFSGKGSQYNKEGDRNFSVLLDDRMAEDLKNDGWNVKYRKPREDDPEQYRQPYLPVKVKFGKYPPAISVTNSKGTLFLDETTVEQLDWTRIKECGILIRPYAYPPSNLRPNGGIAAYVKTLDVIVAEDAEVRSYIYGSDDEEMPFE